MQKKLEAELISIAHRILKLKNKSELDQLHLETGKLYEKLSVLRFLETHFSDAKPTIGQAEVSDKLNVVFDQAEVNETPAETEKPEEDPKEEIRQDEIIEETPTEQVPEVEEPEAKEVEDPETEIPEETIDSIEEEAQATDQEHETQQTEEVAAEPQEKEDQVKPSFELSFERKEETEDKKAPKQISFEDLLGGHNYSDDIFERAAKKEEAVAIEPEQTVISEEKEPEFVKEEIKEAPKPETPEYQNASIDKSEYEKPAVSFNGKTISFGLNDRIGFEKNLFGGSSEDMNRVISQLNTFNTFGEAQDFIEDMVKPDYNNWENKDDYAQRFMDIVEKKFS